MENKVSIITPVYNASRFLEQTAESVFNQIYQNWEWILIDDNSVDGSWELMKTFAENDARVKIFKNETNSGAGKTRNEAIRKAEGRFIAFLDADDIWHNEKLSEQVSFMLNNGYNFSHTAYGYLDESGEKIKSTFRVNSKVTYHDLLKRTEISCLTAMYDSAAIGKFYMSEHSRKQDYALWLKILKAGHCSYGLNKELAYYRQVKGSATSNKSKLVLKHISFLKETQKFTTLQALYYTGFWMVNGFIRHFIK